MSEQTPDPVADPSGYQRLILSLLGGDDPAEVQASTPAEIGELVARGGDAVRSRPEPNEWSVLECLGHMLDAEIVATARYRWVLAQDRPRLIGYDQDLWVDRLGHREDDPGDVLALFEPLRHANLGLWARSDDQQRPARACTRSAAPRATTSSSG